MRNLNVSPSFLIKFRKVKISSTKFIVGTFLSLLYYVLLPFIKNLGRLGCFSTSVDHLASKTSLFLAVSSFSALILYYIANNQLNNTLESTRLKAISKRKQLKNPEDKYASLKVDKRYLNPFQEWTNIPFYKTALFWSRRWKGNGIPSSVAELESALPVIKPDLERIFNTNSANQSPPPVTFTWFGQSTCLMTVDGLTVLTDPVFSKRSINDYLGPKRLRPIPCKLEDFIDKVDIVLVSHDHFDHLDEAAVRKLGNSVTWYIPLGLNSWFLKRGIHRIVEMDWWQKVYDKQRPDIMIACVPAMHWSGSRTPFDKNNTLWCSYIVKAKSDKLFFCGDTGYSPDLFKAIGNTYKPITLAAIPIGSFMPTTLMQHLHMGPEDAIKAHVDLGSPRLSVGIHWGTFMMSDEHYLAPRQVLRDCWISYNEDKNRLTDELEIKNNLSIQPHSSSLTGTLSDNRECLDGEVVATVADNRSATKLTDFITTAFGEIVIVK